MSNARDDRPGSPGGAERPRQVTLAAWLVMAASAMLVLSVFEQLSDLRSLETRTAIEQFLREPPGSQLGLGRESAMTLIRTVAMAAAGMATAAVILGWHVLKRSRSARIALTVLAVPLFLCGLVTGGFLASVVLASVAMLWLAPSRHWFAGTTPRALGQAGAAPQDPQPSSRQAPSPQEAPPAGPWPPRQEPPRQDGPRPDAPPQPPPWSGPHGPVPWGAPAANHPLERPPLFRVPRPVGVTVACAITWASCALTALLSLTLVAALASDAEGLLDEMKSRNPELMEQGVAESTLESLTWTIGITLLVWALASGILAVLAFNRRRWAAISLVVSAGLVALFCLAGSLVSPPLVVPGVLAAATAVLLLQPASQRWLSRRDTTRRGGMV